MPANSSIPKKENKIDKKNQFSLYFFENYRR